VKTAAKLVGLAVVIFLASCANDVRIVKRKYNSGYYVSTGSKINHQNTAASVKSTNNAIAAEPEQLNQATETAEMPVTASSDNTITPVVKNNFPTISQLQKKESITKQTDVIPSAKEQKMIAKIDKKAKKAEARMAKKQKKGGADANLVLLVILCFFPFLNLIAMYLKDGSQITMNFWIDLLLDCLFFFPGIIFALLVVLDIINLG
jgi:uncharacterized membrane protein YqaE (UPF0057 family)